MTLRSVHWHEGMFLWPQHVQLAERFQTHKLQTDLKWNVHYNWGLHKLDLDEQALATHRFVIRTLEIRMRDGTLVALPDQGKLPALDFTEALNLERSILVYLAVPVLHLGRANVYDPANPHPPEVETPPDPLSVRYHLDTIDLEDENTDEDPQPTPVRLLNVKLLTSADEHGGFDLLPLARIDKSDQPDGLPRLETTYIPPLLDCAAWKPLQAGILQAIFNLLGRKIEVLANQALTRNVTFDSHNPGDALLLGQLHTLNQAYALWSVLAFADGVHPFPAYLELCRLVGQLAIFGDTRQVPELPRYDHDDLGTCFYRVKKYIESIHISEPNYEEAPFIGEGLRIQVALQPKWLEPIWEMYVGVESPLKPEECIRLLTKQGLLDMKIGSSQRVDEIFDRGSAGLEFTPSPKPPRALPSRPDLIFFQINRVSQKDEWENVRKSLTLAIRLNQKRIVGTIQGQRILVIQNAGETTRFQFNLFLVQRGANV